MVRTFVESFAWTRELRGLSCHRPSERYVMHVERRKHCFMQRATLQRRGDELRPRGPSQKPLAPTTVLATVHREEFGNPGDHSSPCGIERVCKIWVNVFPTRNGLTTGRTMYEPSEPLLFFIGKPSSVNVEPWFPVRRGRRGSDRTNR